MFPNVPEQFPEPNEWLRRVSRAVNLLLRGKSNNTGSVTLTANTTTTTVTDKNVGADSVVLLSPTTANAAAALGTTYVSTKTAGTSFVLTHANNAQTDRTFNYVLVG